MTIMSNSSVKINEITLKRLRQHLVRKYDGELYGKIGETVNKAVRDYLDRNESRTIPEKIELREAVHEVESEFKTTAILLSNMPELSIEYKLYLAYFYGTRKDVPTVVNFNGNVVCNI